VNDEKIIYLRNICCFDTVQCNTSRSTRKISDP